MDNYHCESEACSSGCDSGWTVYLEYSSISPWDQGHHYMEMRRRRNNNTNNGYVRDAKRLKEQGQLEEQSDEDLSMVSDASSGPPHLREDEQGCDAGNHAGGGGCFYQESPSVRQRSSRENRRLKAKDDGADHSSLLDDTASSPFMDFSTNVRRSHPFGEKNTMEYSQGFSTTQFQVRLPYEGYYESFQSSSGNQLQQQNHGWLEDKSYWSCQEK